MEPEPRTTTMTFPAQLDQVSLLRSWAKESLPALGVPADNPRVHDVQLTLSELGANAVVHGCGAARAEATLTATLHRTAGVLRVSVTDPGSGRPEQRPVNEDATSGRGLHLVTGIVDRFGTDVLPWGGKEVWAELDLPTTVQPGPAAAADTQVRLQIAALRADTAVRRNRPRQAVGTIRAYPLLRDRMPAA